MNFERIEIAGNHPAGPVLRSQIVCVALALLKRREHGAVGLLLRFVERMIGALLFNKHAG